MYAYEILLDLIGDSANITQCKGYLYYVLILRYDKYEPCHQKTSGPALVICGTSQVLLAGASGAFPGVLPFRPTCRLARLGMSEIILKGTLN